MMSDRSVEIDGNEITLSDGMNCLTFGNGIIDGSAYSYEIDSFGDLELDKDQVRKLYEFMHAYYQKEQSDD
jgi:hypothetical protein